jgi:heptosyltransferase-3
MLKDQIDLQGLRRVLVTKLRHHGDVLLASPVLGVLKRHAAHLEIDALVYADTAPLLAHHPALAQLHTIDRTWKQRGALAQAGCEWRLWRELARRDYDLIVHLTEHPRGAWLKRLLGARYAVAPQRAHADWLWRSSFTHYYALPRSTPRHTVELNLDALRRIGVYPEHDEKKLVLVPGADAQAAVAAKLAACNVAPRSFLHLHPGSRWQFKCWPADATAALIDALHAQGRKLVLTAAPDDSERALIEAILARVERKPTVLAGELSLLELAALTAQARLFVGVDSAPMHIAAAMQTPVIALFGPSGEQRWGPWLVPHRVVASTQHPCRPCGNDGCGGGKVSECLTTLPVVQVLAAIESLLEETETPLSRAEGDDESPFRPD